MHDASATLPFWSLPADDLLRQLGGTPAGLSVEDAARNLARYGPNTLHVRKKAGNLRLLLRQFTNPIVLILIVAAVLSAFLHDPADAAIILTIVFISGLLGFWQEHGAAGAVDKLLALVELKTTVLRSGQETSVSLDAVVPGDLVLLRAGSMVPGDSLLLEAHDLFVDEAALTGETFPAEKKPDVLPAETPLAQRSNALFMGTHIVSGTAKVLVARTGVHTEFGAISAHLAGHIPETDFEHGIRHFGYLLMEITLLLVVIIFAVNVLLQKPVLASFLFSLALAVGLTPQLLPAIISVNLARGARRLADRKVIAKRLSAIENFGSMNVLCSDKTGTLTEGIVRVHAALGNDGQPNEEVLRHAYLNAVLENGFANPIDDAIRAYRAFPIDGYTKRDEVPYDFVRKRLSVLVESASSEFLLVTKGAFQDVLAVCTLAATDAGEVPIGAVRGTLKTHFERLSTEGFRTLGIARKHLEQWPRGAQLNADAEAGMTFLGILVLADPPKAGIAETIADLAGLGVALKMITGDNALVAGNIARQVGINEPRLLTGSVLRRMSDNALVHQAATANVFAEIEPNQKERIILALRKSGQVVGYMGDGINDAPALHAADVSISVNTAVDVAKEAADFVLLEQNLAVLVNGVREGRRTFANTMKYIFMATSANFGNMFSMAGASLFLPFLPLLPRQILLMNLLTDFPEMTIAGDRVDPVAVEQPRRWNLGFIRRFMFVFGILSSVFDFLTFGLLILMLHTEADLFRTAWFVESVVSATLIVLVVRTRFPFPKSRPALTLQVATFVVIAVVVALPYTPLASSLGLTALPLAILLPLGIIVLFYIVSAEIVKHWFYRREDARTSPVSSSFPSLSSPLPSTPHRHVFPLSRIR